MAWRLWRRHLHAMHAMHGPFGSQSHRAPDDPRGYSWGQGPHGPDWRGAFQDRRTWWWRRGPQWGGWHHGAHGIHGIHGAHGHHGPSREEMIAHLEQYQRDLEEETIAVAARIKELRAAGAPGTPGSQPGSETRPPSGGASEPPVL